MRYVHSSSFKAEAAAKRPSRVSSASQIALRLLRRIARGLSSTSAREGRSSAELTTQPPPSRGQAMRDAHRTLRARMRSHPSMRQVLPHLSLIERGLAKKGSRALYVLPLAVLQRGLEQLAVLQREDEPPPEAMNLRVVRLRLIEAIAVRTARHDAVGQRLRSTLPSQDPPIDDDDGSASDTGNSDLSSSAFDDEEVSWGLQQSRLLRAQRPH